MRFPNVAACALTAVSVLDLTHATAQAAQLPPATPSPKPTDVVVPTDAVKTSTPQAPIAAIAQPETLASPMMSSPASAPTAGTTTIAAVPTAAPQATTAQVIIAQSTQSTSTSTTAKPTAQSTTKPTSAPRPSTTSSTLSPDLAVMATNVTFEGVDPEIQDILRRTIATKAGGQTSLNQLQKDVQTILDTGLCRQATVKPIINRDGIDVTFTLQPTILQSLQLTNAKALTPAIANQIFQAQLGKPIQPSALNQGIRDINQWYADHGYNLARVIGLQPNNDGVMQIAVTEGNISDIKIRFIDDMGRSVDDKGKPIQGRTKESFIRKEIKLAPGQPFQESIAKADLDRLVKTGLFLGGRVSLEGDSNNTIVVYNLAERQLRNANFGGGYSSDSGVYGTVSYKDYNFNGVGKQIGANLLVGTRDIQFDGRYSSPYRDTNPNAWGYSINGFRARGLSQVFDDKIKLANGDRIREGHFGGGVTFTHPLDANQEWNGAIGLNYSRTSLRDNSGNLVKQDRQGNPLSWSGTGLDDLYTVSFTATRDQRNSISNPTQGSLLQISTAQSLPIGVGHILSNRLQANYSQYIPINLFGSNPKDPNSQQVLAFNVQGGTTIGDLAPYAAFTMGGVNSVRGYGQGDVGIGRTYLQASAEYRFPIYKIIGGTVFADYGTTLGSQSAVLGNPGIARGLPGSGFGIGAGLRVNSPIGIVRLDWGFNDQGGNQVQFALGQKF